MNGICEYLYRVNFVYGGNVYSATFSSTKEIKPDSDKLVVWGLADCAINEIIKSIKDESGSSYPHKIVVSGPFGSIKVKD